MTRKPPQDPVQPAVTFDSYVIPETVTSRRSSAPAFRFDGAVIAVSVIGLSAFVLGVLVTLHFAGPRPAPVAQETAPAVLTAEPEPEAKAPVAVTRQGDSDLLTPSPSRQQEPVGQVPALREAVLKGLKPDRTVGKLTEQEAAQRSLHAQAVVNRNKMRMLREGVLAGAYSITATEVNGHQRLVLDPVNTDLSRDAMRNLLQAAIARGDIDVPASLSTARGETDLDTMLFHLVQTSLADDGTAEGAEAAREMSRRAFAASKARTQEVRGQRVYTVEQGDSLGYISLQFYGSPNDYQRIFDANRDALTSPDLIRIGQRLIIPG